MKTVMSFAASFSLVLGGIAFTGCATNERVLPESERGGFAGGNGAFGETPENAGNYRTPAPARTPSDTVVSSD